MTQDQLNYILRQRTGFAPPQGMKWALYGASTVPIQYFETWDKAEHYLYEVYESKGHTGYEIKKVGY